MRNVRPLRAELAHRSAGSPPGRADPKARQIGDLEQVLGAGIKVFLYDLQEVYSAIWGLGPDFGCAADVRIG
jgi:hypothetical protein